MKIKNVELFFDGYREGEGKTKKWYLVQAHDEDRSYFSIFGDELKRFKETKQGEVITFPEIEIVQSFNNKSKRYEYVFREV